MIAANAQFNGIVAAVTASPSVLARQSVDLCLSRIVRTFAIMCEALAKLAGLTPAIAIPAVANEAGRGYESGAVSAICPFGLIDFLES